VADPRHRGAVDEVVDLRQRHLLARLQRPAHARAADGLDEAGGGRGGERGEEPDDAGGEAAAADRDDDGVGGAGELLDDLEAAGRLALYDVGVVEGRQKGGAGLDGESLRRGQGGVEIVADEADLDPAAT